MNVFIYKIYLVEIPNICYIGSTVNPKVRFTRHKSALFKRKHYNYKFQEKYNLCLNKDLIFEIICKCNDDDRYIYEYEKIINEYETYNLFIKPKRFGDSISYHPKNKIIIGKIRKKIIANYSNMTKKEIKQKYGMSGINNPNWKGGISVSYCKCGNKKSLTANTCANCRDRKGVNNPFYGKSHNSKTIERISISNKGRKPINTRKVYANGIEYDSATEASRNLGCTVSTILNRCNSIKNKNFFFIL